MKAASTPQSINQFISNLQTPPSGFLFASLAFIYFVLFVLLYLPFLVNKDFHFFI